MEASVRAEVHAFLEQVEQQYEPALAVIRNHPFVQGVAQGTVPLAILRQFAHAEYWYMRGGVKHFALSIMVAPDLETQRFYHQRLSGELEYLERFRPFLQALGLAEEVLDRSWPAPRTLSAVNFLFRLSIEGGPRTKRSPDSWWDASLRRRVEPCARASHGITSSRRPRYPSSISPTFTVAPLWTRSQRSSPAMPRALKIAPTSSRWSRPLWRMSKNSTMP